MPLRGPAGAAAATGAGGPPAQGTLLAELGRHYAANPALATVPGSGWKPYSRFQWFQERRFRREGAPPAADARWTAWRHKRAIEAEGSPFRSSWFSLGPVNFAGRALAIDFDPADPAVVYVGTASGGVFKSLDSGLSWLPIADGIPSMAVGGLGVSRADPQVVVIATGEGTFNGDRVHGVGILRSTDAGGTWITTSLTFPVSQGHGFHVLTAGPDGSFLAGATDGLHRSLDGGATWSLVAGVAGFGAWYDVQWDPQDPLRVYAVRGSDASGNGVHLSTDGGATWTLAGTGQPASALFGKTKIGASGDHVYAYVGDPGFGPGITGLFRSTDDGATWTQAAAAGIPTGQSWYNLACAVDPNNAQRVICGAIALARSNDGGATFTQVGNNVHVDQHALKYEPGSNSRLWTACDGGAWLSTTDGSLLSWQERNSGMVSYQFYDICVNNGPEPYYVMGGTQDNGTDKWSGTTTWADGLGADGMVCNIDPTNGTTVFAEWQVGNHHRSTASGAPLSFVPINNGITGGARWVAPVDQSRFDGDVLYTETSDGIFKTTDAGDNWFNVSPAQAIWISVSPVDDDVVWSVELGSFRRSTDAGVTWPSIAVPGFPVGYPTKIVAHPTEVLTALATFSDYGGVAKVARSTDGGASWHDVTGDLPDVPANGIAIDPASTGDWYLATDLGVWHSDDGGAGWTPFGSGLPNVVVEDVEIQAARRKLVVGTYGRGAWEIDLAPDATGVAAIAPEAARNLMLDEAWPNPALDRTLLRYAARSDHAVTLRIFDVTGRLVSELERLSRGDGVIRTTPWYPDGAPSGVYLAVLQAGNERRTRKITVLR
jgi:hypothetical protein